MAEPKIRLLVVEDDPDDFLILRKMLEASPNFSCEMDHVLNYDGAMIKLGLGNYDVCLLDFRLQGKTGLEFLSESNKKGYKTPVIFLTGQGDHQVDMEAMKQGAADFLHKAKLDPDRLERAIRYAMERKKAQDTLRQSEDFFRAVIENNLEGLAVIETDGRVRYTSPSVYRILGFSPDERIGANTFELLHPDDFPRVMEQFERIMREPGSSDRIEVRARHKNGSWRQMELSVRTHEFANPPSRALIMNFRDITERLEAARALEESQSRFKKIFEESPIGMGLVTSDAKVLMINPKYCQMLGYEAEELIGVSYMDFIPPEDLPEARENLEKMFRGETRFYEIERRYRRRNGEWFWGHMVVTKLNTADGAPPLAFGMMEDITEQKKAMEIKERLAEILENTPDAVISSDRAGKILSWNKGAENMYGYTADEIIGKSMKDFQPENLKDEIDELIRMVRRDGIVLNFETKRQRKDGDWFDASINISTLKEPNGIIKSLTVMTRDVTEMKKAREAQERLTDILNNTQDAIINNDLSGVILHWNKGAEKMFGYSVAEARGQKVTFLAPEGKEEEIRHLIEMAGHGKVISNFETQRRRKDGSLVDVSITISPFKDETGKVAAISAIVRDISEQKKAENALKNLEEQNKLAQKMEAVGRLAGGVAHDFNNLLSVIGGNAEFLLSGLAPDGPGREELEEIQKATKRGSDLTKQLLVFGHKDVFQATPVNLNELCGEIGKMLQRLMDATIRLTMRTQEKLPWILADAGQIQQVILNLALNSRDAMPQGGELLIETRSLDQKALKMERRPSIPPGSYVKLRVKDAGIGMSPEVQQKMFEPFFTTKGAKGTGLGLASVYGIVQKWSGHIFVESSLGMGTTVSVYFPALTVGAAVSAQAKPAVGNLHGSETILLAEDEEPLRKLLVRNLEKYGYKVLDAADGLEAVKKAWEYPDTIHFLLTDTVMPRMNGRDLAEEIARNRPDIKVLFTSGYSRGVLSDKGMIHSGIHLLQKPFELEELVRKIRELLDER